MVRHLKDIFTNTQTDNRNEILALLAKEDAQTLSLAYLYAKNMQLYGADVTKVWDSAVVQSMALESAYMKGYSDGRT